MKRIPSSPTDELLGKISRHIEEITGPTGGWLDSPAHMQAWLKLLARPPKENQ